MQITPIRFGAIHIVSREKIEALQAEAKQTAETSGPTYADLMATALSDKAVLHPGYYKVQDLKDKRRVILTNSGTPDLKRYNRFLEKRIGHITNLHSPKKSRHESWDIPDWTDEFITHRSVKHGIRLNIVE